jgi:ribonuclease P protein component
MRRNSKKIVTEGLIFFIKENNCGLARLGFAVSKKVGKANVRNKFRRVIREHFRQNISLRSRSIDILVVGKNNLRINKSDINSMLHRSYEQFSKRV